MRNYFKYFSKALNFIPAIALTVEAFEDGVLKPDEIVTIIDRGLDAAGIQGLDDADIVVQLADDGEGFAVHFSAKAARRLAVAI